MMTTTELAEAVRSTHYPLDAFVFVQRGLDFTVKREHGEVADEYDPQDPDQPSRHISGEQLCYGLRDFAIQQYGLMAGTVLRRWRVNGCEDFGRIVFAMVEAGMMHKTETDTLDDFTDVFSFRDAFGSPLWLN